MDLADPRFTDIAFRLMPALRGVARELANHKGPIDAAHVEAEVVAAVSKRVQQIEAGLSPELEFIAAVNWLGQTVAINRIDQTPLPSCYASAGEFKVPDIICVASIDGRKLPLLIEVKRNARTKLVWSEKYMAALRGYADTLKLPLLVAWKYGHMWTLTDVRHLQKKVQSYHLDWTTALKENLMSAIFGDQMVIFTQRISFYLDAEISDSPLPLPKPPDLIPQGSYTTKVQGAGFLLDGEPITPSNELSWLFFSAEAENEVIVTGEKNVRVIYTPQAESMFSLTDFALMLLLWGEKDNPDWDNVVRKTLPISASSTRDALLAGIKLGIIQYVIVQQPVTMPDFLSQYNGVVEA